MSVINIPVNRPYLSHDQLISAQPAINDTITWLNNNINKCKCLNREKMIEIFHISYKNLLNYFDQFKGTFPMSTKVFANRLYIELVRHKIISLCDNCNTLNMIEKFVNISVKKLLLKGQEPVTTDFSSRSAFFATSNGTACNKRPLKEAVDSLNVLFKKKRTPFTNIANSLCLRTYSRDQNK